ncbi:ubiquitin ligase protein cop1, partial [Striga asiatica]
FDFPILESHIRFKPPILPLGLISQFCKTSFTNNLNHLSRTPSATLGPRHPPPPETFRLSSRRKSKIFPKKSLLLVNWIPNNLASMVSIISLSIEFDRGDELYATPGVSRCIKTFEFATVLDGPADAQFPIAEMSTRSN